MSVSRQKGNEMLSEQTAKELGIIEAELGDLQQRLDAILYQANRHATTNEDLTTVDDLTAASRQLTAAIENIENHAIHFE